MGKNARLFDNVYTFPVKVFNGQVVNNSVPQYFGNYPFLNDKRVKAISVQPVAWSPAVNSDYMITLIDVNGEQLLFNQPVSDLVVTVAGVNRTRLRLFNLFGIDLQRSYFSSVTGVGFITNATLFNLNFYY